MRFSGLSRMLPDDSKYDKFRRNNNRRNVIFMFLAAVLLIGIYFSSDHHLQALDSPQPAAGPPDNYQLVRENLAPPLSDSKQQPEPQRAVAKAEAAKGPGVNRASAERMLQKRGSRPGPWLLPLWRRRVEARVAAWKIGRA